MDSAQGDVAKFTAAPVDTAVVPARKFDGGRAMAVIALGTAVVVSFALEQPFAGVLLGLTSVVIVLGALLMTISAFDKQARRRRSRRNSSVAALGGLSAAPDYRGPRAPHGLRS